VLATNHCETAEAPELGDAFGSCGYGFGCFRFTQIHTPTLPSSGRQLRYRAQEPLRLRRDLWVLVFEILFR